MSRDGFDPFFNQRYSRTVLLLMVIGANQADAEDAMQEAMIAAWQQWESIRDPTAWLRTTAIRAPEQPRSRRPATRT